MRSRALLSLLIMAAAAVVAFPAGPAWADSIGVGLYADMEGTQTELTIPAFTPYWLYLVLDRPLLDFLREYCIDKQDWILADFQLRLRCRFEIPANIWIINFDESVGGQCGVFGQSTDPEIDVTWRQSPCIWPWEGGWCEVWPCMMRIALMGFDERPAPIRMLPGLDGGTAEGLPVFNYVFSPCLSFETCSGRLGLYPLPGGPDEPVFVVNRGPVAAEGQTWGSLKALYR